MPVSRCTTGGPGPCQIQFSSASKYQRVPSTKWNCKRSRCGAIEAKENAQIHSRKFENAPKAPTVSPSKALTAGEKVLRLKHIHIAGEAVCFLIAGSASSPLVKDSVPEPPLVTTRHMYVYSVVNSERFCVVKGLMNWLLADLPNRLSLPVIWLVLPLVKQLMACTC